MDMVIAYAYTMWLYEVALCLPHATCVCLPNAICFMYFRFFVKLLVKSSMGNQLTGIAPSQILPVEYYLTDVADCHFETRFIT